MMLCLVFPSVIILYTLFGLKKSSGLKYVERFDRSSSSGYKDVDCDSLSRLKELSFILAKKMQQLGQLSCEIAKDETSLNGGWCAKISAANSSEHRTDEKFAMWLNNFLKGCFLFLTSCHLRLECSEGRNVTWVYWRVLQ